MKTSLNLKKSKKKGFTLIELIIVIAIIGILALIAIPKFGGAQKEAKTNADIASAKTIANATSMLITKGEIGLKEGGQNFEVSSSSADEEGKLVAEQLQNVPKPKSTKGEFFVEINNEGDVSVLIGENKDKAQQIYPDKAK